MFGLLGNCLGPILSPPCLAFIYSWIVSWLYTRVFHFKPHLCLQLIPLVLWCVHVKLTMWTKFEFISLNLGKRQHFEVYNGNYNGQNLRKPNILILCTITHSYEPIFNPHIEEDSVWRIFVFVFVFANISLNIHISIRIRPFLSPRIYLYLYLPFFINPNIFIFVFVLDMDTEYISICIILHRFNQIP